MHTHKHTHTQTHTHAQTHTHISKSCWSHSVRTLLCKFLCACVCLCACVTVPDWTDWTVACARAYAGLVRNATSYAFNKHIDTSKGVKAKDTVANVTLTRDDFMRALSEYKPAFGVADDAFEAYPREDIVLYAPRVQVRACVCVCVLCG
jgi:hypothetical protein